MQEMTKKPVIKVMVIIKKAILSKLSGNIYIEE